MRIDVQIAQADQVSDHREWGPEGSRFASMEADLPLDTSTRFPIHTALVRAQERIGGFRVDSHITHLEITIIDTVWLRILQILGGVKQHLRTEGIAVRDYQNANSGCHCK